MALLARRIRDQIKLVHQYETRDGPLHSLYENFQSVLIHDLTIADFADMYAQTVAYGLFSASCTPGEKISVKDIPAMVPNTNPFLKKLFEECTRIGEYSRDTIDLEELGVSELVEMLEASNIEAVLQDFGKQKKGEDPVIHFYELFLSEYDSEQKVKRGVFYTPDPVVSFIVRSVDYLLRTEFDCPDGLADTSTDYTDQVHKVQILDPATGTGTFLKYVIEEIKKTFDEKHKGLSEEELRGKWNEYVPEHLLPRVFGFELMMAPYTVAHLKLGLELKETGYDFKSEERLGVYLTNTLEGTHKGGETLDVYFNWLAEEVNKANTVKAKPILAIIGNPPYSVSSENKSRFIEKLMEDYKKDVRKEKNIQPLSDDYIKFIRFAHWKLEREGKGILGFITNNSYLSGVIHRGMRKKLFETFDIIYILNLHGSSRIGEKTPEGGKDENVFDIQQGVAIALYVKLEKPLEGKKVYYADSWGLQNEKYKNLFENYVGATDWQELEPKDPYYFFEPKDFALQEEYDKFWKVVEIFKEWSSGINTHRDHFVIGFAREEINQRLEVFSGNLTDDKVSDVLNLKDTGTWELKEAREKIKRKMLEDKIYHYAYRPFDNRWICYEPFLVERDRMDLMKHILNKHNFVLATIRKIPKTEDFSAFSCRFIGDRHFVSDGTYFFPLYLYSDKIRGKQKHTTNFTYEFSQVIKSALDTEPTAEEIFYYIHSVLYSPTYRTRYEEFLKIDFPRIPLTSDNDLFKTLSRLGSELVSLHLMESPELDDLITEFRGGGDNVVGGYQVCQKWLKDRKGRALSEEDILHYQKIVVALNETIRIMKEIDEAIDEHGGWPIQ
jgi:predicted helicase